MVSLLLKPPSLPLSVPAGPSKPEGSLSLPFSVPGGPGGRPEGSADAEYFFVWLDPGHCEGGPERTDNPTLKYQNYKKVEILKKLKNKSLFV